MTLLHTIAAFVLALGALIVVHEYGHYFVARLCGVKVLRFSIGFGLPLWKRRFGRDQTEWVVAAVPLGGYVKMLDEREGEVAPQEMGRAFNRQSVWRRYAAHAGGERGVRAGRNHTRDQWRAGCVLAGRALAHAATRAGAPRGKG